MQGDTFNDSLVPHVLACQLRGTGGADILTVDYVPNKADSEIRVVDRAFGDDVFKQNGSWDDFGTIISGIEGTHQNFIGSRMQFLLIIHRFDTI